MRTLIFIFLVALSFKTSAQFPPPAGQAGTTAMFKDSSAFIGWATGCTIQRGPLNIANPGLGNASLGDSSQALGVAGSGLVSLGDGGKAILTFAYPIVNKAGYDFAIFENAFQDDYLEFAFVEVSSNGINYFRFPATCNSQDTAQLDNGGLTDARKINNLAGKYRANYGTPFDLEELKNQPGLDVNHITHIKIIDVVGSIQDTFATKDMNGHKINDPWPTPFNSCGFDLDAVGVIHSTFQGFNDEESKVSFSAFPNPASSILNIVSSSDAEIFIYDMNGKIVFQKFSPAGKMELDISEMQGGIYFVNVQSEKGMGGGKIMIKQ